MLESTNIVDCGDKFPVTCHYVTNHQATHSNQDKPDGLNTDKVKHWKMYNGDPSARLFSGCSRQMHWALNQQVNCICILHGCRMHTSSPIKLQSYCFIIKMKTVGSNSWGKPSVSLRWSQVPRNVSFCPYPRSTIPQWHCGTVIKHTKFVPSSHCMQS